MKTIEFIVKRKEQKQIEKIHDIAREIEIELWAIEGEDAIFPKVIKGTQNIKYDERRSGYAKCDLITWSVPSYTIIWYDKDTKKYTFLDLATILEFKRPVISINFPEILYKRKLITKEEKERICDAFEL